MEPRYWWLSRCKGNNIVLIFYFTKTMRIYIISEQQQVLETEKMCHWLWEFIYLLKKFHLKKSQTVQTLSQNLLCEIKREWNDWTAKRNLQESKTIIKLALFMVLCAVKLVAFFSVRLSGKENQPLIVTK